MATSKGPGKIESPHKGPAPIPAPAEERDQARQSPAHAPLTPVAAAGGDAVESQAAQLLDPRLQRAQRQRLAAQIGRMGGNRHLQRVLGRVADTSSGPSRTAPLQRQPGPSRPAIIQRDPDEPFTGVRRRTFPNIPVGDDFQPFLRAVRRHVARWVQSRTRGPGGQPVRREIALTEGNESLRRAWEQARADGMRRATVRAEFHYVNGRVDRITFSGVTRTPTPTPTPEVALQISLQGRAVRQVVNYQLRITNSTPSGAGAEAGEVLVAIDLDDRLTPQGSIEPFQVAPWDETRLFALISLPAPGESWVFTMNANITGNPLIIETTAMANPAGRRAGRVSATSRIDREAPTEEEVPADRSDWITRAIADLGTTPSETRTRTILTRYQAGELNNNTDGYINQSNANPLIPGSLYYLRGGPIPEGSISHYTRLITGALRTDTYERFLESLREPASSPDHAVTAGLNMVERTYTRDPEVYGARMMNEWVVERQNRADHILSVFPRISQEWSQA